MKKELLFLFLLIGCLAFTACSESDNEDENLQTPPVILFDNEAGIYPVKISNSITITPLVENAINPSYSWKDSKGKIVSTNLSYTFFSKEEGKVYFMFTVNAKNGIVEREVCIDVVEKMIPSVSLLPIYSTYVGKEITITPSINYSDGLTYEWKRNDQLIGSEPSLTFKATEEGKQNITLIVSNEDGQGKASTSILVSAKPEIHIAFERTQLTVPLGRAACVAPIITDTTSNATYTWELNGQVQLGETKPTFTFTPSILGSYEVKVTGVDGGITKSASQTVICSPSSESKYYRAPTANSSDSKIKVFDLLPAPGQFVAQISGRTTDEACRYAENHINTSGGYISLGAWGGYIVIGLDHSIYNKPEQNGKGGYDFSIIGNAFKGSSEPGIVYVMQDENGNGLPDDTWYELRGSESGKPETYQNYAVTYYRPALNNMSLLWTDNRGKSGSIDLNPRFPSWVKGDSYTLRGTRLKRNTRYEGIWFNDAYPWGYADNWGEDILTEGDNHDAAPVGNAFKIENAMHPDGSPVKLKYIDFIKVQTGIQSVAGVIGELSTEVFGFIDYRMSDAPSKID